MPNIKSAKKRVKVAKAKTLKNQMTKTALKTTMKKFSQAVADGNKENALAAYKEAVKRLDKAVAKGLIHVNHAAHKKSQFTKQINAL